MGQPAFAFARAGMSASRGIETLRDCEIQDGDLQNLSLREAKNETSKPVTNNSEILRSGQNFPRPTFFQGTILYTMIYPYKWASLPAHINTATILRWYNMPRLIHSILLKFLFCLYKVEALAVPLAKISARVTGILASWASQPSHRNIK